MNAGLRCQVYAVTDKVYKFLEQRAAVASVATMFTEEKSDVRRNRGVILRRLRTQADLRLHRIPYVYQLPDKPLYTIGYECKDIDRDYTVSRKIDNSTLFEKDLQHVGFNTGLRFIPGSDVLCRTYIKSAKNGESGMQIYKGHDLVADVDVPSFFNFLGYSDGYYYGSSYIPIENDESTTIAIYRLRIKVNNLAL